jgi:hypothetical protein
MQYKRKSKKSQPLSLAIFMRVVPEFQLCYSTDIQINFSRKVHERFFYAP